MSNLSKSRQPAGTLNEPAAVNGGLRNYYILRAAVSLAWVAAAFTVGRTSTSAAAALLIVYPAWDALANLGDAVRNGGLRRNPSQAINIAVSVLATIAVTAAIGGANAVLGVFGAWAILSGLLQLATGVRRWKSVGAQWAMILSGAQSALAGAFFIVQAGGGNASGPADVAPYAAFGAFYFLVSAIWMTVRQRPRASVAA